jgi:hypothetical protein
VRSLFVIETTVEAMQRIMARNPAIGRLCSHEWILLSLVDPTSKEISVFQEGRFRSYRPRASVLPQAATSVDWYRGWRDHLEFVEIQPPAYPDRGRP